MARSSSGYYGVSWHKTQKRWFATINHQGKALHLGTFTDPESAARAYNAKAVELRGPNCPRLNFRKAPPVPPGAAAIDLNGDAWTVIDAADFDAVNKLKWTLTSNGAAVATLNGKKIQLHRFIMNAPDDLEVDHKDQDRLNNRRSNLRLATKPQNTANRRKYERACTSRFKGVCRLLTKSRGKWVARICHLGKIHHLGTFKDEVDAACAYDKAALEMFGEFASINFPAKAS